MYIPKLNFDNLRPPGIPNVVDRVIQQVISRILILEYDPYFSDHSYGFRPHRNGHEKTTASNRELKSMVELYKKDLVPKYEIPKL